MGVEREAFSQLADTHRNWLSDVETAFVAESDREHESQSRAARTRARWTRMTAGAFAVLFMMAAGIAWWGNELRLAANRQFIELKSAMVELSKQQQEVSNMLEDADEVAKALIVDEEARSRQEGGRSRKKEAEAVKKEAEAAKQEALDKLRAMRSQ